MNLMTSIHIKNQNKEASILDYQKTELCPKIWEDNLLRKNIKLFIYQSIKGFFISKGFKGFEEFVSHIYIGSSLATYFYKEDSDLDIKVVIDPKLFKKYNTQYENSLDSDIADELIEAGRKSPFLTNFIPNTTHPMDFYFFTEEEANESRLIKYDSLYNLITDEWIKEPHKLEGEVSSAYILNHARDIAKRYIEKVTADLEETRRDSIDFLVLRDYMKSLDKSELKELSVDFQTALERVNRDVNDLIEDKKIIRALRKNEFSKRMLRDDLELVMGSINYSDGNLIYKILQRYGYLRILFEIASMFDGRRVSSKDVLNIYKILSTK